MLVGKVLHVETWNMQHNLVGLATHGQRTGVGLFSLRTILPGVTGAAVGNVAIAQLHVSLHATLDFDLDQLVENVRR